MELVIGWSLRAPPGRAPSFALTAGEEIGWCEYMLTRLVDEGIPRPILAGGVIRGLWHMPVVLAGGYAAGP